MRKFPPRGYRNDEYPLPHNSSFAFSLNAENETLNSTILPIFRQSEACINAESIEVNPNNTAFAEEPGATCFRGSIIPKVNISYRISMTKGAIETDKMRSLIVNVMPIYTSFLDSLDAEDEKTATDIEGLLSLEHATDNKDTQPIYSAVKLLNASSLPMTTLGYTETRTDWGIASTDILESVAFSKEGIYDTLQYKTNAGMLKKVMGNMRAILVTRDRPYRYYSNNFTYPTVKRMNPYTFCGILFHLEQAGSVDQVFIAGDTTDIPHIHINGRIRFDEWNNGFEQAPV